VPFATQEAPLPYRGSSSQKARLVPKAEELEVGGVHGNISSDESSAGNGHNVQIKKGE
jgi:hypothetical protein